MIKKLFTILNFITVGFLCVSGISNAQDSNYYSISGNVTLLVGLELTTPIEVYIVIKSANKFAITDSLGKFQIDSLTPGKYLVTFKGFGYQPSDTIINVTKSINNLGILIVGNCDINMAIAQRDIKKNKPRLLLSGGIVPVTFLDQDKFEKKFGIKYYDYGCVTPSRECIEQYNKEIFKYLDNKFGKSWRREVRRDVVGFKRWK